MIDLKEAYAILSAGDILLNQELEFLIKELGEAERRLDCLGPMFALAANELRRNIRDCRNLLDTRHYFGP